MGNSNEGLLDAATKGNKDGVIQALKSGADVNAKDKVIYNIFMKYK